MRAKIVIELSEEFLNFIKEESNIETSEELKGVLKGVWLENMENVGDCAKVTIEVEE